MEERGPLSGTERGAQTEGEERHRHRKGQVGGAYLPLAQGEAWVEEAGLPPLGLLTVSPGNLSPG